MIMDQKKVAEYKVFTQGLLAGIMVTAFTAGRDGTVEDFVPILIDHVKHLPEVILEKASKVYARKEG